MRINYCCFSVSRDEDDCVLTVNSFHNEIRGLMRVVYRDGKKEFSLDQVCNGDDGLHDPAFWRLGFVMLLMKIAKEVTGVEEVREDNEFVLGWLNNVPFEVFDAENWADAELDDDGNVVEEPAG